MVLKAAKVKTGSDNKNNKIQAGLLGRKLRFLSGYSSACPVSRRIGAEPAVSPAYPTAIPTAAGQPYRGAGFRLF